MNEQAKQSVRSIVRGAYDVQKLRIQMGNRIIGNFKVKLGQAPGEKEDSLPDDAKALLEEIRSNMKRSTDGVLDIEGEDEVPAECDVAEAADSKNPKERKVSKLVKELIMMRYKAVTESRKRFPTKAQFGGDAIISNYTELCLIGQYVDLLAHEEAHFRRLGQILEEYPIWTQYLQGVRGVGFAMAGVIISEFDITKAKYVSSLWKYAGLDVAPDGRGRSWREEHLIEVTYTDKDGKQKTRKSITYNKWLKTKLMGVLATCFLRTPGCHYRDVYDQYKHRLECHAKYGVANDAARIAEVKAKTGAKYAPKGHRHTMAMHYAVKMFLKDLYNAWRPLEGLEVYPPYSEAKLGMRPHDEAA